MATVPRTRASRGGITFEEFCARSPDGQKADLIDGEVFVASPDSFHAGTLFGWLHALMSFYVEAKDLGQIVGSRIAFRLGDRNGPEPDLAILHKRHASRIHENFVEGPPDLAMEIVSPESIERDYEKKYLQYQRAGVPEYWIIDEELEAVRLFVQGPRHRFREVPPRKGTYHSQVLPGFRLDSAWLWSGPRPKLWDTLQQLLGGGR